MSYLNGRLLSMTNQQGLRGFGFTLTDDGNHDTKKKRLTNVGEPQSDSDASTKSYVDQLTQDINNKLQSLKNEIFQMIIDFQNKQSRRRFVKKSFFIPKINNVAHNILTNTELGVDNLKRITLLNIYVKRDQYHFYDINSDYVAGKFSNLEIALSHDYKQCFFFQGHPSSWSLEAVIEYIIHPEEISDISEISPEEISENSN